MLLQYQPSITQFARKYCATPEDVEDAVQETLWTISRRIGTLRAASAFVSWAFQITRNHCYHLLNKTRRQEDVSHEITSTYSLDEVYENPEHYTLLQHDLVTAIAHLPAAYRQILILRDIEGYTAPEVADMLGLTLETVKSRLHRARNSLREMLKHWK